MDKRIIKTKRAAKTALIDLLQTTPFAKITVTEICRESSMSRITFYTYYASKEDLIQELYTDFITEADGTYHRLQVENNPLGDALRGYENLLECIHILWEDNPRFFNHVSANENPYLYSEFCNATLKNVESYIVRHHGLIPRFPAKQTAALLCSGILGVIGTKAETTMTNETFWGMISAMYRCLLSALFRRQEQNRALPPQKKDLA